MNEGTVADLKQFITRAIMQQTSDMRQGMQAINVRLDHLEAGMATLNQKVDDGFAAIAEAFDTSGHEFETRLDDHEQRLGRLEAKSV